MPFQKSKHLLVASLLVATTAFANDENILSKERLQQFKYDKEKNEQDSAKLEKDWINPINLQYIQSYGETVDSKKTFISINQPIFRSGGIYSAIKYANYLQKYTHLDIEVRKKAMIKDATILLFNIHKTALNIKKQALLLKNAQIDVERKKEQVLNGFLDTSFLDNAILEANLRKNTLVELKFSKQEFVNNFNNLASGSYKSFDLPKLKLMDKEEFTQNNLTIKRQKADITTKDKLHDVTIAKYLPSFNVTYDYTKYHDIKNSTQYEKGDDVKNYGFNVTMPLDVRTFNDIQSRKIDYLKAQTALETTKLEEQNLFNTKLAKIKMLNEKVTIAQDDYKQYESLLAIVTDERDAELKTQSDVDTLSNSQKVKALEIKIYSLEKQIELLELYAKIG
jgi:outer membrane protein TolC